MSAVAALTVAASLSAGASGALSVVADPTEPPPSEAPNVVIVLLDDARVDDLETMPRVRSLIGDAGATFETSLAPFPLCCPARATLLTGQYAHNHGVLGNAAPLGGFAAFDDSQTLGTWLDPDYATGWVGKYLNQYGGGDTRTYVPPGWDHWAAPIGGWANYRQSRFNLDGNLVSYPGRYQTDAIGDLSVDFVTEQSAADEPFFLVTSILAPHAGSPLESDDPSVVYGNNKFPTPNVADEYRDYFAGLPLQSDPSFNEADVRDKPTRPAPLAAWEIDALTEVNQQRRESLLSAQDVVRRVISALSNTGELDNTYIVLTSDNGYVLGEHRIRGGKVQPYEVSTRVPLLIRGPGIPAGTRVEQQVGAHDLAPTVLAMTRHEEAAGGFEIDGVDLLSLIADPDAHSDRPIVLEAGPKDPQSTEYLFRGIRTPEWKYVDRSTKRDELYDLVNDPYELENRFGDPALAYQQAALAEQLEQYADCAGAECR